MIKRLSPQARSPKFTPACLAAFALLLAGFGVAQNAATPVGGEQTAPALPADEANHALATPGTSPASSVGAVPVEQTASSPGPVEDYTEKIGSGLKERERRLTLLNEAMMKLREAGEMEDAARVEDRIRALLAMPAPSQANAQLKSEIEQLRTKNDELIVQVVAMEEELKRFRGNPGSVMTRRR